MDLPPPPPDSAVRRRSLDVRADSYAHLKDVEGGAGANGRGASLKRSETDFGERGGMDVAVKVSGRARGWRLAGAKEGCLMDGGPGEAERKKEHAPSAAGL
jgi:hypothetical protein